MSDFARLRLIWEPRMLSISRIMLGLLFLEHGTAKVFGFPLQPNHQPWALSGLNPGAQGLIELIGGFLFAFGLFTRPVAFILAGDVAVAYFMAHAPRGFFPILNGGELAIVYCFAFLYFWLAGGGEWSLDRLFGRDATATPIPSTTRVAPSIIGEPWTVSRMSAEPSSDRAAADRVSAAESESRR